MNCNVCKKIFLLTVLFINEYFCFAQTEYLVTVDPSNAAITKIDSIPGVTWIKIYSTSTYCENTRRYSFIGGDDPNGNPFYLFTIDAISGKIISNPLFVDHNKFFSLQYSGSGDILYGIVLNHPVVSLVTVNVSTGSYSVIRNIPGLTSLMKFIVDDLHNRFIFLGPDNKGDLTLMTMDISSGNIISKVHTPRINNLVYNKLTDKFYAISNRNSNTPSSPYLFSISSVNPNTGVISPIVDLPNLVVFPTGFETLDENRNIYFFPGYEKTDTVYFLYSVDLINGSIIHKPAIHMRNVINEDNLIEFRYDNKLNRLYALFWEAKTIAAPAIDSTCNLDLQTKIYPNPFSKSFFIDKMPTLCRPSLNLYNMIGQLVVKGKVINNGRNEIQLSNLSAGIYFYEFISENKVVLAGKLVKY